MEVGPRVRGTHMPASKPTLLLDLRLTNATDDMQPTRCHNSSWHDAMSLGEATRRGDSLRADAAEKSAAPHSGGLTFDSTYTRGARGESRQAWLEIEEEWNEEDEDEDGEDVAMLDVDAFLGRRLTREPSFSIEDAALYGLPEEVATPRPASARFTASDSEAAALRLAVMEAEVNIVMETNRLVPEEEPVFGSPMADRAISRSLTSYSLPRPRSSHITRSHTASCDRLPANFVPRIIALTVDSSSLSTFISTLPPVSPLSPLPLLCSLPPPLPGQGLSRIAAGRLHKELAEWQRNPPHGFVYHPSDNLQRWSIDVHGAAGTLYAGEVFQLQVDFPSNYPLEAPQVIFSRNPPVHPHIYSNGHICLDILYDSWSPAMTVSAVCLSILSMLSSCKEKVRPADNDRYVQRSGQSPKNTRWWFHDDQV
ncbi:unnamed protein product [Closterium sp. Naga37s-1]|nr:unnamed protein product [Closterium sp. Naga37s-1]